jgi:hypothetical protein
MALLSGLVSMVFRIAGWPPVVGFAVAVRLGPTGILEARSAVWSFFS